MNRPGPLRGTLAPLPRNGYTGIAELSPIFIERSSFMADRVDVRLGGRGRGGREGRFSSLVCVSMMIVFLEKGGFFRGSFIFFIEDFILFYSSRIFVVFIELDRLCIID